MPDDELLQALNSNTYNLIVDEIFNRYSYPLYGLCNKYLKNSEDSKDAVQSIFEKIIEDLSNHNIRNLKSWLMVVAKNHCLMSLRKRQIETKELTPENSSVILLKLYQDEVGEKADSDSTDEQISAVLRSMEQLTTQQSICLTLMYLDDKSYKEICDITGFSMNEVKSHIQNGKRNLRKLLTESNEE